MEVFKRGVSECICFTYTLLLFFILWIEDCIYTGFYIEIKLLNVMTPDDKKPDDLFQEQEIKFLMCVKRWIWHIFDAYVNDRL